jgi:aminopeptidase N
MKTGSLVLLILMTVMLPAQEANAPLPGVPHVLAQERASAIRNLRYALALRIPREVTSPVDGQVVVRFEVSAPRPIVLDFAGPPEAIRRVSVAGRPVNADIRNQHVIVPAAVVAAGENSIAIDFTAGDEPLNRNEEFLYSLFVPARARLAFPCFDQPDLKARFTLTLEIPDDWEAVSNAPATSREAAGDGRLRVQYAESAPLPTYLFSFAAGKFMRETAVRDGRELAMLHRETDAAKVARNRDAIFDLHATALSWLETYTGLPYAFGKFDFVLVPSFQFGGMEHPGAILYNASRLLLEKSATQQQQLERASLIAHETAHMWFGDLVTMRWFDDVWMKEVFANFMAAKIVNPSFPQVNHDVRFLWSHYPAAYQVDRSAGTNPIRQPLANLQDAGQLYGPIIYQKAPIVMRQLELQLRETELRDGLREYLRRYEFGNATWHDLVALLDTRTTADLLAWSRAWVEERGRPRLEITSSVNRGSSFGVSVQDPMNRGLVWPQQLRVAVGYPDRIVEVPISLRSDSHQVIVESDTAVPTTPEFVLGNGGGLGYGLFVLDERSREYLLSRIEHVPDPLTRASAWVTLWDNMLERTIVPTTFVEAAIRALPLESDEQNTERLLGYLTRAFWAFLSEDERGRTSPALERLLREGLDRARTTSQKAAWFNAYRDTALSPAALTWLERVWRREERVPGLPLAEPDEITLALELAVREVRGWREILRVQETRTENPDRKARFTFVMPALSADATERERAFERLRLLENRRREPWVIESLRYLNHPLRSAHARRFIRPVLEMLEEIQRTGDIFFPTRWMESTLWGHSSPEAAETVTRFLAERPAYPERLQWTILSTADELLRMADRPASR